MTYILEFAIYGMCLCGHLLTGVACTMVQDRTLSPGVRRIATIGILVVALLTITLARYAK